MRGSFEFARIFGFNKVFQIVQTSGPKDTVLVNPGIDSTKRLRIQLVNTMAAFAVLAHKMSATE